MDLTREQHLAMHRSMVRIRLFEEAAGSLMEQGKMPGFLHLYVGQEAVAVGVCEALRVDDFITSTHRGHGHLVAKGGDLPRMMAELMGKATGYCGGKGGSMHINDLVARDARGQRRRRSRRRRSPSGRGSATSTSAPTRSRWRSSATPPRTSARFTKLPTWPVRCICRSCSCASTTSTASTPRRIGRWLIADVVDRAAGYGMPGVIVDGMDVIAVYEATSEAVERARRGEGPTLVEAKTYRFYNHHGIQNLGLKYRPDEEVVAWKERDPIFSFEQRIDRVGSRQP